MLFRFWMTISLLLLSAWLIALWKTPRNRDYRRLPTNGMSWWKNYNTYFHAGIGWGILGLLVLIWV
jgi:hypothetical protein